ncbi:RNA polymerase sigma factor, partial [Pricia sp.]|uniref:RNA polymerase sigma factor n=1 Tax=Pricia sp. TaxID=2268138 RepID=UPI003593DFAA
MFGEQKQMYRSDRPLPRSHQGKPNPMNMDQLVANFQNRDIAAFGKLYEMYSPNIRGAIRKNIVGIEEDAQEICQDVFAKVWHRADQYNASRGRFFTWLLKIARNAAIDKLRSKDFRN